MFEVEVSGKFVAAHQLRLRDGTLEPPHEHDWRVTATFAGETLDEAGMLVDFTDVKRRLDELLAKNVAAHVAEYMADGLPEGVALASVAVEEAPGCVARCRPRR